MADADTLAGRAVLAHATWIRALAEAAARPWRHAERWCAHDLGAGSLLGNQALLLRPLADADAASFLEELDGVCPPLASCLLLSRWSTPDLRPFGFDLVGHPPLMVRHPAPLPAAHADLEVREARGPRELDDCERVLLAGVPADVRTDQRGAMFPPAILARGTRFWVAYASGRPVATAASCAAAGVTMLECVATAPDATGRGYGSALVSAATAAHPSGPALVVASEDGRHLYAGLDYVPLERWTAWARAADSPTQRRAADAVPPEAARPR